MVSSQPHDTHNNGGSKRRFGPLLTHATTKSPKYAAQVTLAWIVTSGVTTHHFLDT